MKIELGKFGSKFKNTYIFGSRPIQDWQRIVVVAFSIILGIFIWSYLLYTSVQTEFESGFNEAQQAIPVKDKEAEIRDVVDKYRAKEAVWTGTSTSI